jgi:YHS domain-containing protein
MNFLSRAARFLFWLLVVSWSVWLLRRFVGWMLHQRVANSQQPEDASTALQTPGEAHRLLRDPVCGMHVDESISLPLQVQGELLHFCSVVCRDKYIGGSQKFAANG